MNLDKKTTAEEVNSVDSNETPISNLQQKLNEDLFEFINTEDQRLTWDSYFMSISVLAAKRSSCSRLHVGCVIVKNNRILTLSLIHI